MMMPVSNSWYNFLKLGGAKRYLTNISWLMLERFFRMAIVLAVGIYVARYLGPARFGLLSYAVSFVALFSIISILGLNSIIVRELVNKPDDRDILLGTVFILRVLGSLLVLGILAVVIFFTDNNSFTRLLIFIIATGLLFQSFGVIQFYFEAKVLSKYCVFSQFSALTIISIAKLVFIFMELSLVYFAIAAVVESIVLSTGLIIVYTKQKLNILHWVFSLKLAKGLLKNSWLLIFSGVAVSVYMRIDQVMIKQMLNNETVGQYAAAVKLSEACYFIPIIICNSLFPAILNAKNHSTNLYHIRLQKLYSLMTWTALPITLVVTFSANHIVQFLYGAKFLQAGPVLAVHIWASVFIFLGVASGKFLIAENYVKIIFCRTFAGMIVNIIANIILIPKYGANGAAVATLISCSIATFFIAFIPKTRTHAVLMLKAVNLLKVFATDKEGEVR